MLLLWALQERRKLGLSHRSAVQGCLRLVVGALHSLRLWMLHGQFGARTNRWCLRLHGSGLIALGCCYLGAARCYECLAFLSEFFGRLFHKRECDEGVVPPNDKSSATRRKGGVD